MKGVIKFMTLEQIKDNLVNEKKVLTDKQFNKFIINLSLFIGLGTFTFAFLMSKIVNILFTLGVIVLGLVIYITVLQYCTEDDSNVKGVLKWSRLWFIWIPLLIGGIVALKFFRFM